MSEKKPRRKEPMFPRKAKTSRQLSDLVKVEFVEEDMELKLGIKGKEYFRIYGSEIVKLQEFLNRLEFALQIRKKLEKIKRMEKQ